MAHLLQPHEPSRVLKKTSAKTARLSYMPCFSSTLSDGSIDLRTCVVFTLCSVASRGDSARESGLSDGTLVICIEYLEVIAVRR
jgi:hypothetical protein